MMLLRDMAFHGKDKLLDGVNLVFVPIFSVDGHERASPYSRPNQRGPAIQGWRHTAQNLNLNRDYGKLDAPEMRAMISLIDRVKPDLYMDIHVTDGEDYQYDVTYGWAGYQGDFARSKATSAWLDKTYLPATEAGLKAAGHIPGQLVFALDDRDPKKGLGASPASLRYSNGYGDAARIATVLVENHSLKPYRQRVLGTYVLLEETLKVLAKDGAALRAAEEQDRAQRPAVIKANFGTDFGGGGKPLHTVSFLGVQYETYDSPASGGKEVRWLGKPDPKPWSLPLYTSEPALDLTPAKAYWISSAKPDVIERLRIHGVAMETLAAPRTVSVDMIRFTAPKIAARASEGHVEIAAGPVTHETRTVTFPAGSVRDLDRPAAGRTGDPAAGAGKRRELLRLGHVPRGAAARGIYRGLRHRPAGREDAGRRSQAEGRVRGQAGGGPEVRRRSGRAPGVVLCAHAVLRRPLPALSGRVGSCRMPGTCPWALRHAVKSFSLARQKAWGKGMSPTLPPASLSRLPDDPVLPAPANAEPYAATFDQFHE
jgi:hypothetical protein